MQRIDGARPGRAAGPILAAWLALPTRRDRPGAGDPGTAPGEPAAGPLADLRVLLVEDETLVMMMIEDMLFDLGAASVETAMGLDEARRVAETVDVDFAVLDVNLSGDKSYPVAERLRARGVPFVFATGYGSKGHDPAWRDAPTVTKPFETEQLGRLIERVLGDRA